MKVVYATGTSGTIGKHLPSEIRPIAINLASSEQEFANISILDDSNLIHLAGIVGPQAVSRNIEVSEIVNVRGTIFLANEFLRKSSGIFFYISTSHVYKPTTNEITESSALEPVSIYARQKLEAEIALHSLFQSSPNRLCIIRLFSVLDWDAAPHLQNRPGYEKQDVLLKKASSEISGLLNDSDCKNFILKVDCEGAETAILRDLLEEDLLEKFSVVLLEWHGKNRRPLEKMLSESGFQSISIKPQARPELGMIYAFNTRTPSSP